MVLHFWLIPVLAVLFVAILGFYLLVKFSGGTGIRSDGRVVLDKPVKDDNEQL